MSKIKDPGDTLDYGRRFKDWLAAGEAIATHTATVPTGLTKVSDAHTTDTVTVWVSGGTAGTDYPVTLRITTNQGRTLERDLLIRCRNR